MAKSNIHDKKINVFVVTIIDIIIVAQIFKKWRKIKGGNHF